MANEPPDQSQKRAQTTGAPATGPTPNAAAYPRQRLLLWLCAFQFTVLLAFGLLSLFSWSASQPPPTGVRRARVKPGDLEPFFHGHPGPWGNLELARITLEPPDEFVPLESLNLNPLAWHFPGYTRAQLSTFFNACDLTEAERAELLNTAMWNDVTNGIVVTPTEKLILGLHPNARAQIYSVLAGSAENDFQFWPYTYRDGGWDEWFQKSGLPENSVAVVRSLTYHRGGSLCFSDLPQTFALLPAPTDRRRLVKVLCRNSALLVKLRIGPDSDVEALTAYWALGGRAKDVKPLLESLTKVQGTISLDVAHLMPPFARKRLNTYPLPPGDPAAVNADCFWTVMNFLNDPPQDHYLRPADWQSELERDYFTVATPTYGDLVFLLRPDETPYHAAVYIADDVVFTKNGGSFRQPWILMKMEDMLARYPKSYPDRVAFLRPKNRMTPAGAGSN